MAKTKAQKKDLLKSYKDIVEKSKVLVFVKTNRLTPNEISAIRKELFDFGSEFKTVKNKIFKIALDENNLSSEAITGGSFNVMSLSEDIVNPSKILSKHIKETHVKTENENYDKIEVIYGFLDGDELTKEQVVELAEMPEKEQSIAMILGIIDQAIAGVANVLQNPVQSYASILDQAFKE